MNLHAAVAAMVIAAQSGNRDPLDDAYRDATPVFDVPALRAVDAVSPEGLYPQGQLPGEFLLYCDGSVGCFPCPEDETAPPAALENWTSWHYALTVLGVRPPWTREEFEDLHEWLSVLIEETELGCAGDAPHPRHEEPPAMDYEPPASEFGSWAR